MGSQSQDEVGDGHAPEPTRASADIRRRAVPDVREQKVGSSRTFGSVLTQSVGRFSDVDDQRLRPGGDPLATPDERGVASAICGLVVCSATLAAASTSGHLSFVTVSVLVTVVVYWVAESYAHALARHAIKQTPLGWSDIRAILSQGWPMVSASFGLSMLLACCSRE